MNIKLPSFMPVLLAASLNWAGEPLPLISEATVVLQQSMNVPTVAYNGHVVVTHWYDQYARTEDVNINFRPPNLTRWEYFRPDGSLDRVVVSNGTDEQMQLMRDKRILKGKAAKCTSKSMSSAREWDLLLTNYHVNLVGFENVAGRRAHVLQLTPLEDQKPVQRIWVDDKTGVVLATKRFHPRGNVATASRFVDFQIGEALSPDQFQIRAEPNEQIDEHGYDPQFLTIDRYRQIMGRAPRLPEHLPMGFQLESVDCFMVNGKNVDHFRYTDGMNVISIFETSRPTHPTISQNKHEGVVYNAKAGKYYYTMMGDVPTDTLKKLFASFSPSMTK